MNTISNGEFKVNWSTLVLVALGFWLSGSLVLDLVIIPGLSASGMMAQGSFASVGYLIFGIFNRIELVCAALILSGFLVFRRNHQITHHQETWSVVLSSLLLLIALIYTYILTPELSSLGLQLNLLDSANGIPAAMIPMHGFYWGLEVIKFVAGFTLLRWCYRDSCAIQ